MKKLDNQLTEKNSVDKKTFDDSLKKISENFDNLDFEKQRLLLGNVVEKIEVVDGELNVYFFDTK